jgi:hypothetical protein
MQGPKQCIRWQRVIPSLNQASRIGNQKLLPVALMERFQKKKMTALKNPCLTPPVMKAANGELGVTREATEVEGVEGVGMIKAGIIRKVNVGMIGASVIRKVNVGMIGAGIIRKAKWVAQNGGLSLYAFHICTTN